MKGKPNDDNFIRYEDFLAKKMNFTDIGSQGLYVVRYNMETGEADESTLYVKEINDFIDYSKNYIEKKLPAQLYSYVNNLGIYYTFHYDAAATDGNHIYINPLFINDILSDKDKQVRAFGVAFALLHEAHHAIWYHPDIMNDPKWLEKYPDVNKMNIAMDLEINYWMENIMYHDTKDAKQGGKKVREYFLKGLSNKMGLFCDEDYAGMVWTEIYKKIKDEYLHTKERPWVLIDTAIYDQTLANPMAPQGPNAPNGPFANKKKKIKINWTDDALLGYKEAVEIIHQVEMDLIKSFGSNWTYDDLINKVTPILRSKGIQYSKL